MIIKPVVTIEPVRFGMDAICTIILDDGILSTVKELYRIAAKYNIKITIAQIIKRIDNLGILQNMEESGRIDIISHTFNHLNMKSEDISNEILQHEIVESKEYLEHRFRTHQIAFVPPHNQLSDKAFQICENHFYAIRRWKRELNFLSPKVGKEPMDWFNLGCKGIGDVNRTKERNDWVDQCIEQRKWLIEMWHNVSEDVEHGYQTISPMDAEEHIDYICRQQDKGKLWVASFVDATKYLLEAQTSKVIISCVEKNKWKICLTEGIWSKDSRFDMPLTLRLILPSESSGISVVGCKGGKQIIETQRIGSQNVALVDYFPEEKWLIISDLL